MAEVVSDGVEGSDDELAEDVLPQETNDGLAWLAQLGQVPQLR